MPSVSTRQSVFGYLDDGRPVPMAELSAANGVRVEIIGWGASLRRIMAPDRQGRVGDVLLGLDDAAAYARKQPYLGAVPGRIAGRVRRGLIHVDGTDHQLACNDGPHHLHGGPGGLGQRLWELRLDDDGAVRCRIRSADGDGGYPGDLVCEVAYRLTDDGSLSVDCQSISTRPTPVNLTSHGYFNLAGSGDILGHRLTIDADRRVPHDEHFGLLSAFEPVQEADDFRRPRLLAEAVPGLHRQHGSLYRLRDGKPGDLRPVARLWHEGSGRGLEVSTDQDYLQLYTGAFLDGSLSGLGRRLTPFAGLCLECEGYPDGSTRPDMGSILAHPGAARRQRTVYRFMTC